MVGVGGDGVISFPERVESILRDLALGECVVFVDLMFYKTFCLAIIYFDNVHSLAKI